MRIRNTAYRCLVPGPGHGELEHILLLRYVLGPAGQRLLHQHRRRQQPHSDPPNHATKEKEETEYAAKMLKTAAQSPPATASRPAKPRYKKGEETIEYRKGYSSHNPRRCVAGVHHEASDAPKSEASVPPSPNYNEMTLKMHPSGKLKFLFYVPYTKYC